MANTIETANFSIQARPWKRIRSVYSQILIQLICDFVAFFLSYTVQYYVRFESGLIVGHIKPDLGMFAVTCIIIQMYWFMLMFFSGMYKNWYERSPIEEIYSAVKVSLVGCGIIVFLVQSDSSQSPRLLFLVYFAVLTVFLSIGRTISRRIQRSLRNKRVITIPAIIIGNTRKAAEFFRKTEKAKPWGYKSDGIILTDKAEFDNFNPEEYPDVPVLGHVSQLDSLLERYNPEELIISTDHPNHNELIGIASSASDKKISVKIEPDLYDIFTGQTKAQNIYGIPLIEIRTQLLKPWQEAIKRISDIIFSALVLVLGLPVWTLVGLIVKLESPGPVFYTQPRVGKNGRIFKIFKFRSMVNSQKRDQVWTVVNDPRVTAFGKFIRKTHLDEIPQFWNVLIGEMSVVGPRPEQPKFVEEFQKAFPYYKRRHIVRPGITGWWQVKNTGYQLSLEEIETRLKDDFYYIENMSIQLDIEIVFRTVWCVIKGHGQA